MTTVLWDAIPLSADLLSTLNSRRVPPLPEFVCNKNGVHAGALNPILSEVLPCWPFISYRPRLSAQE